jgi:plasmid stabilization system protein ParE
MKILITDEFLRKRNSQIEYIARDKPKAARQFKEVVFSKIRSLEKFPKASRKSVYFNNENIREGIIKRYKIIFRINPKKDQIEIFGFIRSQNKP